MLARVFWVPYFTTLSVLYRLADKIDRGLLCRFFYFNYRGRPAAAACEWGKFAYEEYMRPRVFQGAIQRIRDLKAAGFRVVLVTGSLSFMIAPLAAEIDADDVIAADLVERDGRFTGEMAGAAFNGDDKAVIVKEYAVQHGIDLRRSHAYGDSIADLGMLESVGHPHAVLPDKRLRQIAELRGWPLVTEWAIEEKPPHPLTRLWV
ncbi:haloacid dehalogenase-like hydrolase (HAD) superfamily protein [Klebsormidium nitens]|uniref:Haloacid dehalogenase-like hydrolase (HAD) superfamily protein n=1 Tax=Klebsormidium nitens TaxID=105231 RepID=A0A1Y1IKK4_KLENI|nr:haloacid dehalogenase-like hydrolase (HAD) superfamily protein [Klebsormidium nitens]|eukprot:GAQ89296.1 haloacid dehalogenase-like hydrolase (HAD) superfamily protein [Klebsormidium nitens]